MKKMDKYNHIHFLGVGGMGVAAAAKIALEKGFSISGSDLQSSAITENLIQKGINVNISDTISWPTQTDLIVHTNAIKKETTELLKAQEDGITVVTYPEFAKILLEDKKIIAISGTHGKTTTTAIIAQLLIQAEKDPLVILGSSLKILEGNAKNGNGEWAVIEADEYKNAFHNYSADIPVITTLEFDHPDIFASLEDVEASFKVFLEKSKQEAEVIGWAGSSSIVKVIEAAKKPYVLFDIKNNQAIASAQNISIEKEKTLFEINYKDSIIECETNLVGNHNILNILAAFLVSQKVGISLDIFKQTIKNIELPWRRFEIKAQKNNHIIIDDYAHHPTEIKATIQAAKSRFPDKKIVTIFEPHHEDRTRELFDDFSEAFKNADKIILTDIYRVPGRTTDSDIDIEKMADKTYNNRDEKAIFIKDKNDIPKFLQENIDKSSVVLVMGAGGINSITDEIIKSI